MSKRFFIIGIAVAVGLILLNMLVNPAGRNAATEKQSSSGAAAIGGPFTLVDQNGETVTDLSFRGKLMLVYFGYSYCPDVCPVDLLIMSNALTQLGEAAEGVAALFITVDPERDTVSQMKSYLSGFHPAIAGLTGDREQVSQAIAAYRVYAKKVESDSLAGYLMDHSAFIYVMDREGKYLAHFAHNTPAEEIAKKLRYYL